MIKLSQCFLSVQCSMKSCFETKFDTIHHAPFAFWSQLSWFCCLSCSEPFNPKTFQCKIITGFENYQCHTMILPTMMVAGLNMKIKKQPKKYCNLRESKDMRKRVVQLLDSLLSRRPKDAWIRWKQSAHGNNTCTSGSFNCNSFKDARTIAIISMSAKGDILDNVDEGQT